MIPVSELQKIAPSSIIELFVLETFADLHGAAETYRFHAGSNMNGNTELVWAGDIYLRFPVEVEGFEYNGQGQLPRPKLRASNILSTMTAILLTLPNGLEGAKVTRIRTLARYIDGANFPGSTNPYGTPDPSAEFPREIYYVDRKVAETREVVEFELAAAFDLAGVRAPKRQCISNICQWVYRSAECGYTEDLYFDANDQRVFNASQDVCGKRLNSCRIRFESIERTGGVVKDSTTLSVSSTANLIPGHSIFGFGIPSGTTVASVTNATQLVMSQAALVSNPVTQTGTVSSAGPTMTVANGANLRVGMTVAGLYIPPGTTIAAISGNTVTLTNRPYEFTRTGTYSPIVSVFSIVRQILTGTSGINPGYVAFGSNGINTTVASTNPATSVISLAFYGLLQPQRTSAPVTLFYIPASPASSTYTFSASNRIVFRTTDGSLPYGSFPGIGTFFA